jgi:hypothetical protein
VTAMRDDAFERALEIMASAGIPGELARDALSHVEEYASEDALIPYATRQADAFRASRK